jgi:hypothetical protein
VESFTIQNADVTQEATTLWKEPAQELSLATWTPPNQLQNLSPGIRKGKLKDGKTLKNHMKSEILSQVHTQEMTKKSKKSPPSKP